MLISDKWFDVIEPRKRTIPVLTDKGLVFKEVDAYELLVDRETKHCWIAVHGLQAQQALDIKRLKPSTEVEG